MNLPYFRFLNPLIWLCLIGTFSLAAQTPGRLEDFTQRNIYVYNDDMQDWVLRQTSDYQFMDTGRIIQSKIYSEICPLCDPIHAEVYITYDELHRLKKVVFRDDEGGSSQLYTKRQIDYAYYKETDVIAEEKIYQVDFSSLYLLEHTYRRFDAQGNMTTFYYEGSQSRKDSITYAYDEAGKVTQQTQYAWNLVDCCNYGWTPWYELNYSYNANRLQQIDVGFWNAVLKEWTPYQRFTDFTDPVEDEVYRVRLPSKNGIVPGGEKDRMQRYVQDKLSFAPLTANVGFRILQRDETNQYVETNEFRRFFTPSSNSLVFRDREQNTQTRYTSNTIITTFVDPLGGNETITASDCRGDHCSYPLFLSEKIEVGPIGISANSYYTTYTDELRYTEFPNAPSQAANGAEERVITLTTFGYNVDTEEYENRVKQEFYYTGERIYNSVSENTPDDQLLVYPNPTRGSLHVSIQQPAGPATLTLISAQGQRIWSETIQVSASGTRYTKDVLTLESGLYILQLSTEEGVRTKKVMVR